MNDQRLGRKLGLLPLVATGVCSMLGASIYIMPFMIHRSVPTIGPYVLLAFALAAVPAIFAAYSYAMLSTAMPRAGGSYLYASRSLSPLWGFIASFSQWFGLSITIGVISYMIIPFARDVFQVAGLEGVGDLLMTGALRVPLALILVWLFVWVNVKGLSSYEKTVIPLMVLMFILSLVVIIGGFYFDHDDFAIVKDWKSQGESVNFSWGAVVTAAAVLFSSFIGFDSIAQAGGEAINPKRNLPRAILITILGVGAFYFIFTAAVYHAIPWQFVAEEAALTDLTAAGLLSYLLSPALSAAIIAGATIALVNDLPAMLLSVSRLTFAWAEDGVFPKEIASIHRSNQTPVNALILSGIMASIGILGCHFAGDFFLGIDIMVTAMLVNFIFMCASVINIRKRNPLLAKEISVLKNWRTRTMIATTGLILLSILLFVHISKDLRNDVDAWYFHSTWVWLIVMIIGAAIFSHKVRLMKRQGVNLNDHFKKLPPS